MTPTENPARLAFDMKTLFALFVCVASLSAQALDYPYAPYNEGKMDPQKTGWPLAEEERKYVMLPEHERRPGREVNQHKPAMWPVVPSAGFWGGTSWLDTHANLVKVAQASKGPIDVLLVGDSITMQWGAAWTKHFPTLKTVNIGIGGDKTQNVLWRLDHGGVDGLEPRLCVLLIGNNNMFFTPETGIEPAAQGIKVCVANLREKFPQAPVIVVKVFPAHTPGNPFYEDIKKVNAALDTLNLETDPKVRVLDIWGDMVNADGTLKKELFTPDNIHLSQEGGYKLYAEKLKPLLEAFLAGKEVPKSLPKTYPASAPAASPGPAPDAKPAQVKVEPTQARQVINDGKSLLYPYAPYNEGKMDPQLTGWPLTDAENAWVAKSEYTRKPGHEVQKHLPEMWFVTPTAARRGKDGEENLWVAHHATCIKKVRAMEDGIDIALLGDSITQGWGGGWDGVPFNVAWQKHFGGLKTVNLGIGGDRMESILWRLDHGALDGASPKVIVLMIGVNNAPLVFANGAPAASAAHGIKLCIENLRMRCPKSRILLVKVLPAFDPSKEVGAKVREINPALDALKLERDPQVQVLDLWRDFTNADGTLKTELYSDGHLHLGPAGYEVLASKLKPALDAFIQ
jgi:platelet-activating factor acetylhydrolase IB subunit beta/gamma